MFSIPLSLKKTAMTVAAGALATAGLLVTGTGAAHADAYDQHIFPLSNIFLYLDVSGGSFGDGAPIIQWTASGDNQAWHYLNVDGHREIVNRHSGKCITTDGVAGHQLYQWLCKGLPGQLWDTDMIPGGLVPATIRNPASSLVMDVSGGSTTRGAAIIGWNYIGGSNQKFNNHYE